MVPPILIRDHTLRGYFKQSLVNSTRKHCMVLFKPLAQSHFSFLFQLGSSIQSVTTDEMEPELVDLVESESDTELPTLNSFTPNELILSEQVSGASCDFTTRTC